MRKQILRRESATTRDVRWLNLEEIASVEITSEDPAHPFESALSVGDDVEWRAAGPGKQTIRLRFELPQPLRRIRLDFAERNVIRTQEYVLRYAQDYEESLHEIIRQQWNFNPENATRETEDHQVDLFGVTMLELTVTPDIGGGNTPASLACLRLA